MTQKLLSNPFDIHREDILKIAIGITKIFEPVTRAAVDATLGDLNYEPVTDEEARKFNLE